MQGSAALLFSHHCNLHPTGWKHHTETSQSSYQCPSPRTWPRYILSGDLTLQIRHLLDTLYCLLMEERECRDCGWVPSLTHIQKRGMRGLPTDMVTGTGNSI